MSKTYRQPIPSPVTRKNQLACQALFKQFSKGLIAEISGISAQLLSTWNVVPMHYIPAISKQTGLPPPELLPDPPCGLMWAPVDDSLAATKAMVEDFKYRRNITRPMTKGEYAEMQDERRRFGSNVPAPIQIPPDR